MGSKFSSKHTILDDPYEFEGGYIIIGVAQTLYDVDEETKRILDTPISLTGCTPAELTISARKKADISNDIEIFYIEDECFNLYKCCGETYLLTDEEYDDVIGDDDDDDDDDDDYFWD